MSLDDVEKEVFGGDEPPHYLRLKPEDNPEVVTYKEVESVPANQDEKKSGYHTKGKTVLYTFVSPLSGLTRTHRSNGKGLLIGLKNANVAFETDTVGKVPNIRSVQEGETCSIDRIGEGSDTRYLVNVMSLKEVEKYVADNKVDDEAPAPTEKVEQVPTTAELPSEENVNVEDIPF